MRKSKSKTIATRQATHQGTRQATTLAVAIALAFNPVFSSAVWAAGALPQGASVVNGQVVISSPSANAMQINASSGAIVNWQAFSIGAGGVVQIGLPSASSAMLNRVVGGDASQILGSLQSNGRVFLLNPNGIVIGAGARIDTNSFVASTLDMSDGDFLAGKLRFLAAPGAGSIRNDGVISAGPGGRIALIAPDIQNTGIIQAPGGQILLAAGRKLEISSLDFEGVTFEIQAPTDSVLNLGKLLADNGAVSAFAGTLRHSGEIRANKMVQDGDGSIRLLGSNEVTLTSDSITRADGLAGGSIKIQSTGGTTRVAGLVSAVGSSGKGGDIQLLGDRVAVESLAFVDASGSAGGGQVLVGGDFQGSNAAVQNASRVYLAPGASLKADATDSGDGGKVVVWADENTRYYGDLSVRGGPNGGNGGSAEVSGKANLAFDGTADLGAPAGRSGTLLLDPLDILVSSAGGILPSVVDQFADFKGNVVTISPNAMAKVNGTVTLQAERDIYINDAVNLTIPGAALTATAGGTTFDSVNGGQIFLNQGIATANGAVTLRAVGISGVGGITTTGGTVNLTTSGNLTYSSAVNSGSGTVNLTSTNGFVNTANVNAGGANIQVTGKTGVFNGVYTTTGTAGLTATAGSVSGNQVTADTVNLSATGGSVSGSVNAASRVNATSTNSSVQLNNLAGQALRVGTVSGSSGVFLTSTGGVEQAGGGLITAPFFSVNAANSGLSTGSAAAPLVLALPAQTPDIGLTLQGMSAPAFISISGAGAPLSSLSMTGTVAGLGGTSITGATNLTTLALGNGGTFLGANAVSTGGLASGFQLNVTDGGLNSTTLNLTGAPVTLNSQGAMTLGTVTSASLNASAAGPVAIGTATTTGNSGIVVNAQKCNLSFSVCTDVSPITAGTLTAGGFGSIQLTTRDNGDITATNVSAANGSVFVNAGSNYRNSSDLGPNRSKRFVTTGNINLGTVTAGNSFQVVNSGAGNITISNPLTAGGSIFVQAGTSYDHDGNFNTPNVLTPTVINVAGLTGSSVNISDNGTGAVTATGNLVATSSSLSVFAGDGPISAMGANTSQSSSSFTSSKSTVSLGTVTTANSNATVNVSADSDIAFQAITANGATANVSLSSNRGSIKTTLDNTAADISSGGNVTLTANGAVNGVIGDASFARPMDIVAGATKTVTLSAGKNIGDAAAGKAVHVDSGGLIDVQTTGGQFFVSAETMGGVAKTVTGIKLSASAAGMGNGGTSTFASQDLSVIANSDGSAITIGDVVQSANRLDRFDFTSAGGGLNFGNVNLTTATGFNQLFLTASGAMTQTTPGTNNINAGYINLAAGSGAVTLGNVTSSSAGANSVGNSVDVSGGNITAGNLTGPSVNVTGGNLSLGSVTSNGTRRGYPYSYVFIPRLNSNNYVTDEMHLSASGTLSTSGNVGSQTSAYLSGVSGVNINAGAGSVTAGSSYNGYYADTTSVSAGSGTLAAGALSAYNVNLSGASLSTGAVSANNSLTVSGGTLNTGTLAGGNSLQVSGTTFNTGNMSTGGSLTINATGAFVPSINLSAGSAYITAPGGIVLGGHLTATNTRLDASGGDILANLNGTTNLTINTGGKFIVTSTGTLNNLDITADGIAAGAGLGSSVSANGGNQTMTAVGPANALAVNWKSNSGISEFYRETSATVTDLSVSTTGALASGSRVYVTAQNANVTAPSVALTGGNVEIYTAGDINLTSVQTNGSVAASTSGTGKNVNVEKIVTTGGSVYLAASDGNISKGGSQTLQIDTRNGGGAASGTLTLSAAKGSVGTGASPLLTSGEVTLDVNAKNQIAVDVANTDLTNLYITTGASGTGAVAVTNANYTGFSLTRGGTDLVLSGVNPTATGAFALNATDGNIRVASNIGNVTNLTLNAGYGAATTGDLIIQASGAQRTIAATGTLYLQAGHDVLIGADNVANAGVTVQAGNSYLQARHNLEINAGSAAGANALVQGTYQQVNVGNDIKVVANGGSALLNSTTTSGQSLQASHDIQITGGSGAVVGATAGIVSAGNQSIYVGNDLLVRAGTTDGAAAKLQAAFSQYISGGNNISVLGGGDNASAAIRGTSQTMNSGPDGVITVKGGTGSNAFAEIVATAGDQYIGNQYTYYYPATDKIEVLGGSGSGTYASIRTLTGSQQLYAAGDINVIGGSGTGSNAELSASGGGQTIGTSSTSSYYVPTQNIRVQAQGGGTARIQASGSQNIYVGGDISVLGGTGTNMTAAIESTGGSQNIGYTYRFGNNPNDNIVVRGGSGSGAAAWVKAATGQTIDAGQNISLAGGATGAYAEISTAAGFQTIGNLNSTSSYDRTDAISLQGGTGANAWAKIASGGGQNILSSTGMTLAGGAGDGSDALILNTLNSQTLNTLGALNITGGSSSGSGLNESGVRNTTGGAQSVTATAGITITGGSFGSRTWINQVADAQQTITTSGALTLQAPTFGADITSIEKSGLSGGQTLNVGDVITLSNAGGNTTRIASGANQSISADALSINLSSTFGAAPRAEVSAVGNQVISLVGGVAPATLTVANFSGAAGSSARLTAGGTQTIGMNYFNAGKMQIGDVNALGESLVQSGGNQTIVVGELTIQGGASVAAKSKLQAGTPSAGAMLISTLNGPIQVLGGALGSAVIDPLTLNGISNGSILIIGGAGSTAAANVTAGSINMAATNGNMLVIGNGGGATVVAANTFNLAASGGLAFTPGSGGASISAPNGGIISLGGACTGCAAGLIGPFNVNGPIVALGSTHPAGFLSGTPNLYGPDYLTYLSQFDQYDELSLSEDGTLSLSGRRRSLNQCY